MIDLDAIKARCEALDERMGKGPWTLEKSIPYVGLFTVYDGDGNVISYGVKEEQSFIYHSHADVPALVAEAERLRASLEEILDEAASDLDRDIIITECQSALAEEETGRVTIKTYPEMNAKIATMLRYNDDPMLRYAAQRIEELERELHDEQVRRNEWEKMYKRAVCWSRGGDVMKIAFGWCKQCTKFADCYPQDEGCYPGPYLLTPSCGQRPEPAPDALPCGHPREEEANDN